MLKKGKRTDVARKFVLLVAQVFLGAKSDRSGPTGFRVPERGLNRSKVGSMPLSLRTPLIGRLCVCRKLNSNVIDGGE